MAKPFWTVVLTAANLVMHGIASVMKYGLEAACFTKHTAANSRYFLQLRSISGKVIGWSEMYQSKQGRDKGVDAVMRHCFPKPGGKAEWKNVQKRAAGLIIQPFLSAQAIALILVVNT